MTNSMINASERKEIIKSKIRTVPDRPQKDILFRDITTLLGDAE